MMTINPAASLEYYLATVTDSDGLGVIKAQTGTESVSYYNPVVSG